MATNDELNAGFRLGDWQVLPAKGVMRRDGVDVRLEPKPLQVLLALARRDGNLATKDQLIDEVWGGRAFSDEPLQRCITQLRSALGDRKPYQYIDTLHRRGYRLLKPVERLQEQPAQQAAQSGSDRSSRAWQAVAGIFLAALIAVAFMVWPRPPAVGSIAVLPMDNVSGDPSNRYIADGIKNVLSQRLAQELPDFAVKHARKTHEGSAAEVAAALGVESVLFAAVQVHGERVKVVWNIVRGSDSVTIGGGHVDGDLEGLFDLQERLALAVIDELAGDTGPELISQATPDSSAYNSYLRGIYALEHRGEADNLEVAIRLFADSIRLDPAYGPAYLGLATAQALMPDYRDAPLQEMHPLAIATVRDGIEADSRIVEAGQSIFGYVFHQQKRWTESEAGHQRAVQARLVDANAFNWYSRMLASVGRLQDSLEVALAGADIDPDHAVVNSRIAVAHSWLWHTDQAQEYFARANALVATGLTHLLPYALFLQGNGASAEAQAVTRTALRKAGESTAWVKPVFAALNDAARREAALRALDMAAEQGDLAPAINLVTRSLLDDVEGAMATAHLLEQPGEAFEMDLLFVPETASLRRHPDFIPLLQRLGIVDYWRAAGCAWGGDKVVCPRVNLR